MISLVSKRKPETPSNQPDGQRVRQTFVVELEHGLHARPCASLVKTLRPFRSNVEVEANGERASGHSIMGLMALAAGFGSNITFTITGKDAHQAMAAIHCLFAARFADPGHAPKSPARPPQIHASDH